MILQLNNYVRYLENVALDFIGLIALIQFSAQKESHVWRRRSIFEKEGRSFNHFLIKNEKTDLYISFIYLQNHYI